MGILSFFKLLRRKDATPSQASPPRTQPAPTTGTSTASGPSSPRGARATPVLQGAVVTEKATLLMAQNQYVFRVDPVTTKPLVRAAVERAYGVHVQRVRLLHTPGKLRRRGPVVGAVPGYRKAIVTLRAGDRIDVAPRGSHRVEQTTGTTA